MTKCRFIKAKTVKQLIKENNKRCGKDFLYALDVHIDNTVHRCIKQFNGHRKTLTAELLKIITGGKK